MASQFNLYEPTPTSRAEVVNRVRDQLLTRACLSLDKNSGIRGRHPFDLFKRLLPEQGSCL
jgi:hypothetical protein